MRIEVSISEVALDRAGSDAAEPIATALERELGRLVAEGGLPAGWSRGAAAGRLVAEPAASAPTTAADTGRAIARAIYSGSSNVTAKGARR